MDKDHNIAWGSIITGAVLLVVAGLVLGSLGTLGLQKMHEPVGAGDVWMLGPIVPNWEPLWLRQMPRTPEDWNKTIYVGADARGRLHYFMIIWPSGGEENTVIVEFAMTNPFRPDSARPLGPLTGHLYLWKGEPPGCWREFAYISQPDADPTGCAEFTTP